MLLLRPFLDLKVAWNKEEMLALRLPLRSFLDLKVAWNMLLLRCFLDLKLAKF